MVDRMRWLVAVAVAIAALAACSKRAAKNVDATEAECTAYRNKMFSLMPAQEQTAMGGLGLDKPTPKELELCKQRMNSDEIQCALEAASFDDALACRSATDDRPDDVKRTPEECKAYADHMKQLSDQAENTDTVGPPLTPSVAKMAIAECPRWLSKKRFDCVMKATAPMALMQCPP
jgi:hypothetical protein